MYLLFCLQCAHPLVRGRHTYNYNIYYVSRACEIFPERRVSHAQVGGHGIAVGKKNKLIIMKETERVQSPRRRHLDRVPRTGRDPLDTATMRPRRGRPPSRAGINGGAPEKVVGTQRASIVCAPLSSARTGTT